MDRRSFLRGALATTGTAAFASAALAGDIHLQALSPLNTFQAQRYVDPRAADNTQGFLNLAQDVQAAGGGLITFPANQTYTIFAAGGYTPTDQFVLFRFTNISGVVIRSNGSQIVTPANLNGTSGATPLTIYGLLCINCSNIEFDLNFQQTVYNAKSFTGGIQGAFFQGSCQNVRGKLTMLGGREGVCISRDSTVAITPAQRAANFDLQINTTNTFYPLACQYNGDNVRAQIFAQNPGRTYFAYNCTGHDIRILSSGQQHGYDDVLIKCYAMPNSSGGATGVPSPDSITSNITVHYKKVDAPGDAADDGCAALYFDQNRPTNGSSYYPGRISGVKIFLDVDETGVVQPGGIVKFGRSGYQGVNDATTVAHVLEDIQISGTVRGLAGATSYSTQLIDFFTFNGGATVDPTGIIARNIVFSNISSKEGVTNPPVIGIDGRCLVTPIVLENIQTDGQLRLQNIATSMISAKNVLTANYTSPISPLAGPSAGIDPARSRHPSPRWHQWQGRRASDDRSPGRSPSATSRPGRRRSRQ